MQEIEENRKVAASLGAKLDSGEPLTGETFADIRQRIDVLSRRSFNLANAVATYDNAKSSDGRVSYFVTPHNTVDRLGQEQAYLESGAATVRFSAAQNEWESVAIIVVPFEQNLSQVTVTASPMRHVQSGHVLPEERVLVQIMGYPYSPGLIPGLPAGRWPDPILDKHTFDVDMGHLRAALLTVRPPTDAPAGDYHGKLTLAPANAHATELPVELRVFDFTLPDRMHTRTAFFAWGNASPGGPRARLMCNYRTPPLMGGLPVACSTFTPQQVRDHIQFCLQNGLNAFAILHADHNLQPYDEATISYLKSTAARLSDEGLLDLAYVYVWDEPSLSDQRVLTAIRQRCQQVHEQAPGLRTLVTCVPDERLFGYVDVWVPQSYHPELAKARRAAGDQVWHYVCGGGNRPNFNFDNPGIDQRIFFWMNWKFGTTGFLYWATLAGWNQCTAGQSLEQLEANDYADWVPGMSDGLLQYPAPNGRMLGSMRMLNIRDGVEDYEYLYLLDQAIRALEQSEHADQHRELLEQARRLLMIEDGIAASRRQYTGDSRQLLALRSQIGQAIERLQMAIRQ